MAKVTFLRDSIEMASITVDGPIHRPSDPIPLVMIREAMDKWGSGHSGRLDIGRDAITPGADWDQVRVGSSTYSHRQFTSGEFSAGVKGLPQGRTATQPPAPASPTTLKPFEGTVPDWEIQEPPQASSGHKLDVSAGDVVGAPNWDLQEFSAAAAGKRPETTPAPKPETPTASADFTLEAMSRHSPGTSDQAERRPSVDPFADTVPMGLDAPNLSMEGMAANLTPAQRERAVIAAANARNNGDAPAIRERRPSSDPFAAPVDIDIPGHLDLVHEDDHLPISGISAQPTLSNGHRRHETVIPQSGGAADFTLAEIDKDASTSWQQGSTRPRTPPSGPKSR